MTIEKVGAVWHVSYDGLTLSTHATRDGAATSANQIIRAEAEHTAADAAEGTDQ